MPKVNQPTFVEKLWNALAYDSPHLKWISDDKFIVSTNDVQARQALAVDGELIFRSLPSFTRQLSYYGFTRISDRRRSAGGSVEDVHRAQMTHVTFTHPQFKKSDPNQLAHIKRRYRDRSGTKKKARSASGAKARDSSSSADESQTSSVGRESPERAPSQERLAMAPSSPTSQLAALPADYANPFPVQLEYQFQPAGWAYPSPSVELSPNDVPKPVDSYFSYQMPPRRVHSLEPVPALAFLPSPAETPLVPTCQLPSPDDHLRHLAFFPQMTYGPMDTPYRGNYQ